MAALVLGSSDADLRAQLGEVFDRAGLVCERSDDVVGVEMAGAAKNAAALAAAAAEPHGLNAAGIAAATIWRECVEYALASGARARHLHRPGRGRRPDRHRARAREPQPPRRRAARRGRELRTNQREQVKVIQESTREVTRAKVKLRRLATQAEAASYIAEVEVALESSRAARGAAATFGAAGPRAGHDRGDRGTVRAGRLRSGDGPRRAGRTADRRGGRPSGPGRIARAGCPAKCCCRSSIPLRVTVDGHAAAATAARRGGRRVAEEGQLRWSRARTRAAGCAWKPKTDGRAGSSTRKLGAR